MNRQIILLAAVVAIIVGCSDNETIIPADEMDVDYMFFDVMSAPSVELTGNVTRGTDTGFQTTSLSPNTRIGMFVMHEADYEAKEFGQPENYTDIRSVWHSGNTSLTSAYADKHCYGYCNEEVKVNADGSLVRTDANQFVYPYSSDYEKVGVIAYSPRREGMDYADLFAAMPIIVDADQSDNAVMRSNDIMIGVPYINNPFRVERAPINLVFSHVMTKVTVNVSIPRVDALLSDSIYVTIDGLLSKAYITPYEVAEELMATVSKTPAQTPTQMLVNAVQGTERTITLLADTGMTVPVANDTLRLSCCAYVPAQTFSVDRYPVVKVHFITKEYLDPFEVVVPEIRDERAYSDKSYTPFRSGTNKVYNIVIED